MLMPGFAGGFYKTLSPTVGADTAVNIFTETRRDGDQKTTTLYGCPGRKPFISAAGANGGNRGAFTLNGRSFVVIGATLYELNIAGGTKTALGTIPNDGLTVTYASNGAAGQQLAICGGDALNVLYLDTVDGDSGTATAGGASTLTDAAATFPDYSGGWTIAITAGTGSGQTASILSNTATIITVTAPWATQPDATSVYAISHAATLVTVTLPFSNPATITFLNGYGILNQADTPTIWWSDLENLASWDALSFLTRSGVSDNIVKVDVARDRLWTFGTQNTTCYYPTGDADLPFLPYPGTTVQVGFPNRTAVQSFNDVFFGVGQSLKGQPRVVMMPDPSTQILSTPPIERFLEAAPNLDGLELLLYEQMGHTFLCVTVPASTDDIKTYSYDLREQEWHARAGFDAPTSQWTRWRVQGVLTIGTDVMVGDYATGDLYTLDLDTHDDDGSLLVRERTVPYLGADPEWTFLDQIELLAQAGVGLANGQGNDPVVALYISRDAAQTWVSRGTAKLGKIGAYLQRTFWTRCGRTRLDRLVLRVRQSDAVKTAWTGLALRLQPGTGQL